MGVLGNQDVQLIMGYLISSFAFGFLAGGILRIFRRGAEKI